MIIIIGAKYYPPEIATMKFHWTVPVNIHWEFQRKFTGKVRILWNIPPKSEIPVENTTESPSENATENPRRFLRCRFLACDLLPLGARALYYDIVTISTTYTITV